MSERRRVHALRPCFLQGDGAGVQGRAGGEDVVDDDMARRGVDGFSGGDDERAADVLPAFLPAEPGL